MISPTNEYYINYQLALSTTPRYLVPKDAEMKPREISNHMEDVMRRNSMLTVGLFAMMAATVALSASNSFASGAQRVDVIDSLPAGAQWDSGKAAGEKVKRVDVITAIESRGPVYPSTTGAMGQVRRLL
jgi:hypothetical protein